VEFEKGFFFQIGGKMVKHSATVFLGKLFETRNYNFQTKNVQILQGSSMCKNYN
jgi:hypothetical protein